MSKTLKIAAIAGDGIGREVMPEGLRVLEAAAQRFDFGLEYHIFEWASCDYYVSADAKLTHPSEVKLTHLG